MNIIFEDLKLHCLDLRTRMPFKYGIVVMRELPHVFVTGQWSVAGQSVKGRASDNLPPKWFTKDPGAEIANEIETMLNVIRQAARFAGSIEAKSPFEFWLTLYKLQMDWAAGEGIPPLLAHFGVSLIERSLLDAFTRSQALPFHEALRSNALGICAGVVHPSLDGVPPREILPARPLERLHVRHTVGMLDPIRSDEIGSPINDGLPESLDQAIAHYGLRQFKIKLGGSLEADVDRLDRIFSLLRRTAPDDWSFSLDANENFVDAAAFRTYWEILTEQNFPHDRLLFVEQPIRRSAALLDSADFREWGAAPPVIIDESDGALEDLPRALELGYAGTSHKNCKGVFKGILNRCLLSVVSLRQPERKVLMSGEDLANVAPVGLQQDLLVQSVLGNSSVERNGYHYFSGLDFLPKSVQALLVRDNPRLFEYPQSGSARLRINKGVIDVKSLLTTPFGLPRDLWPSSFAREVSC